VIQAASVVVIMVVSVFVMVAVTMAVTVILTMTAIVTAMIAVILAVIQTAVAVVIAVVCQVVFRVVFGVVIQVVFPVVFRIVFEVVAGFVFPDAFALLFADRNSESVSCVRCSERLSVRPAVQILSGRTRLRRRIVQAHHLARTLDLYCVTVVPLFLLAFLALQAFLCWIPESTRDALQ
jgi:hypothetical protein